MEKCTLSAPHRYSVAGRRLDKMVGESWLIHILMEYKLAAGMCHYMEKINQRKHVVQNVHDWDIDRAKLHSPWRLFANLLEAECHGL